MPGVRVVHVVIPVIAQFCLVVIMLSGAGLILAAMIWVYFELYRWVTRPVLLRDFIKKFENECIAIPLGHENRERGASSYNWTRWFLSRAREFEETGK